MKKSRISLRATRRRNSRRPFTGAGKARRIIHKDGKTCPSKVSAKLEALKSLIPSQNNNGEVRKTDQLFQETADYIVQLKTQVVILQRLIEVFGSSEKDYAVS